MISIIIPSKNAEKTIKECLKSVFDQNFKGKYEVIVVDSSIDKTPEIASKFSIKLIVEDKDRGPGAARNLGVKKSKGNIVVFLDSDCVVPRNWLKNLLTPFLEENVACVVGAYKTKNKENLIARFSGYEIQQRHEIMGQKKYVNFAGSYNCAYKRDIFMKFGGFDEKFKEGEDAELSFRIADKYKIVFQQSSFVYHYHVDTLKGYIKEKFNRGYWKLFLFLVHKKKTMRNTYTPSTLYLQPIISLTFILFIFLSFFVGGFVILSYFLIIFSLLIELPFIFFLYGKEHKMVFFGAFLILIRNFSALFGILYAFEKHIFK